MILTIKARSLTEWVTFAAVVAAVPFIGFAAGWVLAFIPLLIVSTLLWQEDKIGAGVDTRPIALAFAWILVNAADAIITLSILSAIPGATEANPVMAVLLSQGVVWFVVLKMVMVTIISFRVYFNSSIIRAGLVLLSVVVVNNIAVACVLMFGSDF